MVDVKMQHASDLAHHVRQGIAWLSASAEGTETAALSYAALELRFAIERLAVHYWATLLNRKARRGDLRDIESFKRVERRIYALAGHQREIDRHFEFIRIILRALNVNMQLHTPDIPKLANYSDQCSRLCHIAWTLASSVHELRKQAFLSLTEISNTLKQYVDSLGWPTLKDPSFIKLRDTYVRGEASAAGVLAYIQQHGVWGSAEFPDGRTKAYRTEAGPTSAIEKPDDA